MDVLDSDTNGSTASTSTSGLEQQTEEAETATGRPTVIDSAYELTVACSATLLWDGEHTYVVALEAGHVRTLAARSKAFKRWLLAKMRSQGVKVLTNAQQWSALQDL